MSSQSVSLASFSSPVNAVIHGASEGLGLALLRRLLSDPVVGCVYATSRRGATDETLRRLALSSAPRLRALDMDITVESSVASAALCC